MVKNLKQLLVVMLLGFVLPVFAGNTPSNSGGGKNKVVPAVVKIASDDVTYLLDGVMFDEVAGIAPKKQEGTPRGAERVTAGSIPPVLPGATGGSVGASAPLKPTKRERRLGVEEPVPRLDAYEASRRESDSDADSAEVVVPQTARQDDVEELTFDVFYEGWVYLRNRLVDLKFHLLNFKNIFNQVKENREKLNIFLTLCNRNEFGIEFTSAADIQAQFDAALAAHGCALAHAAELKMGKIVSPVGGLFEPHSSRPTVGEIQFLTAPYCVGCTNTSPKIGGRYIFDEETGRLKTCPFCSECFLERFYCSKDQLELEEMLNNLETAMQQAEEFLAPMQVDFGE